MAVRPRSRRPAADAPPAGAARWTLLVLAALVAAGAWLGFQLLAACFVLPVFGEVSGVALAAALLLGLGAPLGLALWMVRPLAGFHRAAWFVGSFAALPVVAVLGLSLGAPGTTAAHLRRWTKPTAERLFGKTTHSVLARTLTDGANRWADWIHARPKVRGAGSPKDKAARPRPRRRAVPRKDLFFVGTGRPRPRAAARPAARPVGPRTVVPFVRRGGAIHLAATARATFRRRLALLLDTGATLSTLNREAAKELGLTLPRAPVEVELETAAGRQSFPVVILPSLRVGRARVDNLTVALCDPCSAKGLHGLLGLNFTEHFHLSIDPGRRTLTLQALSEPRNRIHDIEPFLSFVDVRGQAVGRRFVLEGRVRNRSPRRVRALRLEAHLLDTHGKRLRAPATVVPRLAPGKAVSFAIEGPGHPEGVRYRIVPTAASW